MNKSKTLIVIGGGASGFFCAINAAAAAPNLTIVLLEKSTKLLSKVRVSGGGRCNVTHHSEEPDDMIDAYPRGRNFVRKALHQFSANDTVQWFLDHGVQLKSEKDGRMFPVSNSSETIVNCLMNEASRFGVQIRTGTEVSAIHKTGNRFELELACKEGLSETLEADFVSVSTGGYPKEAGFDWLKQAGHGVEPPVPSLFTFNIPDPRLHGLMGVSGLDAVVKLPSLKMEERGAILITHWGLSGPAVLKLSARAARQLSLCTYSFEVVVNWVPDFHETTMLQELKAVKNLASRQQPAAKGQFGLSSRLWNYLIDKAGITAEKIWADVPQANIARLAKILCQDSYLVNGKTTFKEEFVTAGGIKLDEIDPLTMQSKRISGLYFTGEVMNVDGITGGYNFQHAWSSGWIAAQHIVSASQAQRPE